MLIELPIYRCSPGKFEEETRRLVARRVGAMLGMLGSDALDKESIIARVESSVRHERGEWKFNQIIGWIVIFADGLRVKGDWWGPESSRIRSRPHRHEVSLRRRVIEFVVLENSTSSSIYDTLISELTALHELKLFRGQYVDVSVLHGIGRCVDWRAVLGIQSIYSPD